MFTKEYRIHYRKNWQIAYPLVLGQAGHMMTNIADTIMVGQLGSTELAAASIANIVFVSLFVFGIGIATGTTALAGKAFGEKDNEMLRSIFANGLFLSIVLGIIISLIMFAIGNIFPYLGQQPDVLKLAVPFYIILVFSMLPFMIFLHYKQFVDGLTMTKPAMIITIVFNVVNIILNYGLIFGKLGLPEMGLNGAAIATVIARSLMAFAFIILFNFSKKLSIYRLSAIKTIKILSFKRQREMIKVGLPIGIQFILEVGLFVAGGIMIGWIGAKELAANQIVMSLAALTYLMSGGIASTATVRISNLLGEKQYRRLQTAGYSSLNMVVLFMFFAGIGFFIARFALPGLYIEDKEVIAIAAKLMIIAALFQVTDGIQVTAMGALRGLQDVNIPTYIALISYWFIALPISYLLGIYLEYGVEGIWYGYLIGLIFASLVLTMRFRIKSNSLLKTEG